MTGGVRAQFDEFRDKDGRQIVDAKIAEVFKVSASLSFTATAHARHDYYPRFVGEFFFVESFIFHKVQSFVREKGNGIREKRFELFPFPLTLFPQNIIVNCFGETVDDFDGIAHSHAATDRSYHRQIVFRIADS